LGATAALASIKAAIDLYNAGSDRSLPCLEFHTADSLYLIDFPAPPRGRLLLNVKINATMLHDRPLLCAEHTTGAGTLGGLTRQALLPSGVVTPGLKMLRSLRNYADSESQVRSPHWHRNRRMVRPFTESSIRPTRGAAEPQRGHRRPSAVSSTLVLSLSGSGTPQP